MNISQPLWYRRSWIRNFLLAVLAFTLTLLLSNCGGGSEQAATTDTGAEETSTETLVYGSGGPPVSLDPGTITDGNSIVVQQQIYNRLVQFEPGTTELAPSLAEAWSSPDDGKTWTFQLREGVQFHDGTDFNAEAVEFNVQRWWDPEFEYGYRDSGKTYNIWSDLFGGFKGTPDSLLQEITIEDDYTITFVLNQAFAAFPDAIASGYFGIASPTAIQEAGAEYGTPAGGAVGTGPFVFEEWQTGESVTMSAYADYWQEELPELDQLVIRFVTDPAARLAQLRAGTLDFTVDLAPDQLNEIESDPNLEAIFRPSLNVGYLALNPSYEPLASPEVRQAIATAINRSEIVNAFWGELGETDSHFLPPTLEEFRSKSVEQYKYDPEQARQALAEAGYPNGFDLDLWYMPVSRPYFPTPKAIAEAFAAELSAIGINVNLQTKDWAAYLEDRRQPPGFQAFMLGWTGDYGDPDNFYYAHFGPGATDDLGNWRNEEVVELLNRGRETIDESERQTIYAQVDEILVDEAVRIPIVHSQPLLAKRTSVEGWTPSPFGSEPFSTITKS
ncbi:MAG: ABC transporter substrate-binding protein [Cyanophyceae cyanobacterium]